MLTFLTLFLLGVKATQRGGPVRHGMLVSANRFSRSPFPGSLPPSLPPLRFDHQNRLVVSFSRHFSPPVETDSPSSFFLFFDETRHTRPHRIQVLFRTAPAIDAFTPVRVPHVSRLLAQQSPSIVQPQLTLTITIQGSSI